MSDIQFIGILGNGAREVAIVKKLLEDNNDNNKLIIKYHGDKENFQMNELLKFNTFEIIDNLETSKLLSNFNNPFLNMTDFKNYIELIISKQTKIEYDKNLPLKSYVVISQEKYLQHDIVSFMNYFNVNIVSPSPKASNLEISKKFARRVVELVDVTFNPLYFKGSNDTNCEEYKNTYLYSKNTFVIKPDGLTGGKGVKIYPDDFNGPMNIEKAENYIKKCDNFLIEERLIGEEFSLMCFTDSKSIEFMPPVQDFKKAFNGNKGCNTGSMGSICNAKNWENNHENKSGLYFLSNSELEKCMDFMRKIINYTNENIDQYKGVLYGSFMKTYSGKLKLIEFNCRFGDPEAINVLSLLKTSLHLIYSKICDCKLSDLSINNNGNSLQYAPLVNHLIYIVPKLYGISENDEISKNGDSNYNTQLNDNQLNDNQLNNSQLNYINSNIIDLDINNSNNIYIASLIKVDVNKYELTTSRAYGILFEDKHHYNCLVKLKNYFISNKLDDKLRRRTDILLSYLDNESKYNYIGWGNEGTNDLVNETLGKCKDMIKSTHYGNDVSYEVGNFSGTYNFNNYSWMASTDGVGTKIILLEEIFKSKGYYIAGQDLVNHNINDILVSGGFPLFFLDYYGCDKLRPSNLIEFIKGCTQACTNKPRNIAIMGGETAIMRDIYKFNTTDLTGTIIGYKYYKFYPELVASGDILVGIPSSGFHTNGFTLLRKFANNDLYGTFIDSIKEGIINPHRCYLELINNIYENKNIKIKLLSHITGGGFYENLNRVIKVPYKLNIENFEFPKYYSEILKKMSKKECLEVFNSGYGLVMVTNKSNYEVLVNNYEPNARIIGNIL